MARKLLATASVVQAYEGMGFTHQAREDGRHEFCRDRTVIMHETVRGAGFDVYFLTATAAIHGVDEELEETLGELKLEWVPYPPPKGGED